MQHYRGKPIISKSPTVPSEFIINIDAGQNRSFRASETFEKSAVSISSLGYRLVEECGEGNWSTIARHFPGRIGATL